MNTLLKITVAVCAALLTISVSAQNSAKESMKADYPMLMEKYGDLLDEQHAHYIFAVDISSSMLQYESTVKENFLAFVDAIPDGDQVTLIRMASKEHTDFLGGMYKCITLNDQVRNDLRNVIYSDQFKFLRNGNPQDGSDGYKMADLVLEAINTIGSNDLTFVYMFTDFEYWTKEFKFNPSQEDWTALKEKMPSQRQFSICKYGLELNFNNPNLKKHAIIKRQLDEVFGPIDYQTVSSAAVLSQWFNHTIANVMAAKLNSLVKRDWDAFAQSVMVADLRTKGSEVEAVIRCNPTDLVSGFRVVPVHGDPDFHGGEVSVDASERVRASLGHYTVEPETWMPSFKVLGGSPVKLDIVYVSPYQAEIDRLQELCKDAHKSAVLTSDDEKMIPLVRVWNSFIPLWVWIVSGILLLAVIVSVLYTLFGIKLDREWQLSVIRRDAEGNRVREVSSYVKAPADIQSHINKRPTTDWVVTLHAKKYNPLNVFKIGKTGYYVTLKQGTFLDIMDPYDPKTPLHTLSMGDEVFVCSHRRPDQIVMQIKSAGNQYKIEII